MKYEYDAVVIGGGAAGLTASGIAANFGAKTMMVERDKLGGDCTWTGCIPSKTLIKAASVVHNTLQSKKYGIDISCDDFDLSELMKHVDEVRNEIYEDADRPEIFENMGIDVVQGSASFLDQHTLNIEQLDGTDRKVTSKFIFICTGSSPFVPPIPGLDRVDYLTNESLFELNNIPKSITIIGAGPIGCEMAQSFARLGLEVTVLDMADRILLNDDPELTEILKTSMENEGVTFELNVSVQKVDPIDNGTRVFFQKNDEVSSVDSDSLLVATGRRPNLEGLNLEAAGINYSKKGIEVNDSCRTSQRHIYAAGDVTGRYQLTHMSDHMAKTAVTKALLKVPFKIDKKHVPWVTFTDPELGHVGATLPDLKKSGTSFETYQFPFVKIDRAITDGNTTGLIKIYAKKWSGKILGASVVGAHAGEMISQYALAMKNGVTLRDFADTIHPYPSYGLGARRAADQWYIKNQSETLVKWIKRIFRYRGEIPDYSDPNRIV
ncbi:mercuric reductase [Rhodohalobacter barkolensis]|uniref:Mercuric reductase n=2 Tax=Rhodohalobacter barkolensis TaxID=2053187 RepID=A0A2N0VL12_9BACT|nr:mercuric reductase [Rhodohalobacter barkolensis]